MKKKSFMVHGAYYTNNFGDLLLLQIYFHWIADALTEVDLKLFRHKSDLCERIDIPQGITLKKGFSRSIIFCGGGYMGEPKKITAKWFLSWLRQHFLVLLFARFFSREIYIFGAGAGPFRSRIVKFLLKPVFMKAKIIIVRDIESKNAISRLLDGKRSDIEYMTDAAFSLALPDKLSKEIYDKNKENKIRVGVHLSPPDGFDDKFVMLKSFLKNTFTSEDRYQVVGLVDQVGTSGAGRQKEAYISLISDSGQIEKIFSFDNVESFCAAIRSCDLVITTKLHVGIVARAFSKQVISIPTHHKTHRLYSQLHESQRCLGFSDLNEEWLSNAVSNFEDIAYTEQGIREQILIDVKEMESRLKSVLAENRDG